MRLQSAIWITALILAAVVPLAAMAQGTSVRSGEHATFSRLVFADAPGRTWDIETEGQTYRIAFSAGVPDLDLSGIFDLIPRTRLNGIDYNGGVLTLRLSCDCPVRVSQIASGHVVIDVENPPTGRPTPPTARLSLPRIPLADLPLLAGLISGEQIGAAPPPRPIVPEPKGEAPQMHRHPMGRVPLLPPGRQPEEEQNLAGICAIEQVARRVLLADPETTLAALPDIRGDLLDGQDKLSLAGVSKLVEIYLSIGWGAEARLIARSSGEADDVIDILSAAFDGLPQSENSNVDPGCGPGSAIIALLNQTYQKTWGRADETRLVKLLDAIPARRMDDLYPRLEQALLQLDRDDLLLGLRAPEPAQTNLPPATSPAAGTDIAAIAAVVASLERANAAKEALDDVILENARALRPSIPKGDMRDTLDRELLKSLVLARRPEAAFAMIEDGMADADSYVSLTQALLPPEDAAVFLVRLDGNLAPNDPLRLQLRDVFLGLGLTTTANRFARAIRTGSPQVETDPIVEIDPWLTRDFAALTDTPTEDRTARTDIAGLIRSRNGGAPVAGDLAIADRALSESRELRDALRRLMATP